MNNFLITNAHQMGVELSTTDTQVLVQYTQLIAKWNTTYNLTGIKHSKDMLTHHILDCLSIITLLPSHKTLDILDIGAGAGLPSVIIALLTPHRVVSVDKVLKKCKFMQYVKAELGLVNLEIKHKRVEELSTTFDIITSRAFSSIDNTIKLSAKLLKNNGKYLLLKGNNWQQEQCNTGIILPHKIRVPGLSEHRYILEITI